MLVLLLRDLPQEGEDLRLHRDIEGCRGFVGDDELGREDETLRYRNALLHAAAQFVRVAREVGLHVGKLHVAQRLNRTLTEHLAGANALVVAHDLRDLLEHRRHGVHRRERVLHDERDLAPANRAHLRTR